MTNIAPTRRQELQQIAEGVSGNIGGRATKIHDGTWLGRPGVSLEVRMQTKAIGRRIVIHKWDDEETCSVRYIKGDFWRPRTEKDVGQEFAKEEGVTFSVFDISAVAQSMLDEPAAA